MEPSLSDHRKNLHQHPELAFSEHKTQAYIQQQLEIFGAVKTWPVAGTGILAQVFGPEKASGFLYRTDIDALPIQESNEDLVYRSQNEGVAHVCGHDGHTAIALGLVQQLAGTASEKGFYVLFQPAEETGMGAPQVMEDAIFNEISFTGALALHNLPGYPLKQVVLSKKTFSASVSTLFYKFYGEYSHAAEPGKGINPSFAISDILQWLEENNEYAPEDDFKFGTPVCVKVGDLAYGTNPGYGELHITVRAAVLQKFEEFRDQVIHVIEETASANQLETEYEELEFFPSVKQDDDIRGQLESTLQSLHSDVLYLDGPNRWGEDFGGYRKLMPTYMFGIGAGEDQPPLHNENYNFPDELIDPAVGILVDFVKNNHV